MYVNLLSTTKKNRTAQIVTNIGANGVMNFYSGSIPPSPDFPPTGTLLATLPLSTTAGVTSLAVRDGFVTNAGIGGTDGIYTLVITGGGGSGAAGTYTVSGGILTSISIIANGSGYTSQPSLSGFGISGLSGSTAVAVMTGVLVFNTITSASGLASGVASFVRVSSAIGTGIVDLDVGMTNGFSVVMNNTFISNGGLVACSVDILLEA